jgi:hypothetical protein
MDMNAERLILQAVSPRPNGIKSRPAVVAGTASTGTFELTSGSGAWEPGATETITSSGRGYCNRSVVIRCDTAGMSGRLIVMDADENELAVIGFKGDCELPWVWQQYADIPTLLAVSSATGGEDFEVILNGEDY